MKKKIDLPMLSTRSVLGAAEKTTSLPQAKQTARFMSLLAWSIVLLLLVWGLYAAEQTVAPLIRTLFELLITKTTRS